MVAVLVRLARLVRLERLERLGETVIVLGSDPGSPRSYLCNDPGVLLADAAMTNDRQIVSIERVVNVNVSVM